MVESDLIMPVDSEHRAMDLRPLSIASPHMRAFHLSWLSLFSCFFSVFSVPPLLPVLGATTSTGVISGVVSLSATFISRLTMGPICDLLGPRLASTVLSIVTAVLSIMLALLGASTSHEGLIVLRFISGLSLGNFVANQYWMSSMFSPSIVGVASAVSAGWANTGCGVAQVAMPLAYSFLLHVGVLDSMACRVVFLLPAGLQIATALATLYFGQDLPQGNFSVVKKKSKHTSKRGIVDFWEIIKEGAGNYRGWILALTYGYCYGVELTTEAIVATFFRERYNLGIEAAGAAAACFGVMNVISRPVGGMAADVLGESFGMRGRLWGLWLVQTVGGVTCLMLGKMSDSGAPPGLTLAVLVVFAFFIQAASGLTFGIVPFISKRALGVISGMTASGGVMGGIVTQLLFFSGSFGFSRETGISLMGLMILICTLPLMLIYSPQFGGMFCAPFKDYDDLEADYYEFVK
ncbi:High-affinity nitrate transporter 2.2 [Rhynchospora pubera]|uniref:High-affinity nitrate transporter 2.2 n=1 Tax=Rhynchospora pubera TaxID=906938 RepID=A0AAV8D0X8_9POAL|nr:High-affinity nitrate transporter 2.2 [Rhynchospora pubera]